MEKKKAYDYPEITVCSLNGMDVIMLSADPSSLDLSWSDQQASGGEQV